MSPIVVCPDGVAEIIGPMTNATFVVICYILPHNKPATIKTTRVITPTNLTLQDLSTITSFAQFKKLYPEYFI